MVYVYMEMYISIDHKRGKIGFRKGGEGAVSVREVKREWVGKRMLNKNKLYLAMP